MLLTNVLNSKLLTLAIIPADDDVGFVTDVHFRTFPNKEGNIYLAECYRNLSTRVDCSVCLVTVDFPYNGNFENFLVENQHFFQFMFQKILHVLAIIFIPNFWS